MRAMIILFLLLSLFLVACSTNKTAVNIYIACGCGCCGGAEPVEKCLYHSNGDDIHKIIEDDKRIANSADCALAGCSMGTKYIYCD